MLTKEVKEIVNKPISNYTLEKLADNIFQLNIDKQEELCLTFLRFQEYYESPKFKNKIFTLEEFVEWYTKEHSEDGENFDYHKEWNGFNIPSKVLKPFIEGKFILNEREKSFLKLFNDQKGDFYIIGTHSEKEESYYDGLLKHELGHGLYYTNEEYKKEVNNILEKTDLKELSKVFKKMGYHKSVHLDESHAYLLADYDYLRDDEGVNIEKYRKEIEKLNTLFFNTLKKTDPERAVEFYIKYEAEKAGIKVETPDTEMVNATDTIKVAGYFDHTEKVLKSAKRNPRYLPILIHEFNHLRQMQEDCLSWRECFVDGIDIDTLIDMWLENKIDLNEKQLREYMQKLINVELDCEKRTVDTIKEFNLESKIDPSDYTKQANSYLMMYHVVARKRAWCEKSPRDNKAVLDIVSDKFDMDYTKISEKLFEAYFETFKVA